MSQEVRCLRRPLTVEKAVQSQSIPCTICVAQIGTGTDITPITSVLSCQYHSTGTPYSFTYMPPTLYISKNVFK
jgi:hypothetical protein